MSAITQLHEAETVKEQAQAATTRIRTTLGIGTLSKAELERLSAALAIAAADEMEVNQRLVTRVKELFESLTPAKALTTRENENLSRNKKQNILDLIDPDRLVPIATGIAHDFDPTAPPDARFLMQLYGAAQLPKALKRYSATRLKETATLLVAEQPLPKLKSKATKDELIAFIVQRIVA
jgi:hypothetical protein